MIVLGVPWSESTLCKYRLAIYLALYVFLLGIALIIFENLSTTTIIWLKPFDSGRGPMKSIETSYHGLAAMGIGFNKPNFL